jgi:hypothetical protein
MHTTVPCPKCKRPVQPAGIITFQGKDIPSYQCDECVKKVEMFGEVVEVALTFCLDKKGNPFDPGDDLTLTN